MLLYNSLAMSMSTMTDSEKYLHQKELNRLRQKKWYDSNKAALLQKKKETRDACKCHEEADDPPTSSLPSNANIVQQLKHTLKEKAQKSTASIKKYVNDIKTFINVTDCEQLEKCLKNPDEVLERLDNAPKKRSSDTYSTNSKKGFIQSVLVAITDLNLKVPKKALEKYQDYFEKLKIESINENEKKQGSSKVEDFGTYLNMVKDKFGETSKEYLLASLYDEATLRDDFHDLKIITKAADVANKSDNYIIVNRSGNAKLVIQSYKTSKKYGTLNIPLSSPLTGAIRAYMKEHNITPGSALFGENKRLSDYVRVMNKKIGVKGSITNFRQMKIAQELKKDDGLSPEKRVELSKKMAHSPIVQMRYLREVK